jgi:hypothetical protein
MDEFPSLETYSVSTKLINSDEDSTSFQPVDG